jgi:membrane protease YdiL (CAAX protease family)
VLLVELPAMAVLFTWVFQHTDGSALLAILFHASWNLSAQSAAQADTVGSALIILALKWALAGVVIAYWQRRRQTMRPLTRRPAA